MATETAKRQMAAALARGMAERIGWRQANGLPTHTITAIVERPGRKALEGSGQGVSGTPRLMLTVLNDSDPGVGVNLATLDTAVAEFDVSRRRGSTPLVARIVGDDIDQDDPDLAMFEVA